jgi:hypothetical protein
MTTPLPMTMLIVRLCKSISKVRANCKKMKRERGREGELTCRKIIEISQVHFNDDSSLSISSSQKQQSFTNAPYSSSYSSGHYLGQSSISISRGPSYPGGQDSPAPRASTSSSSLANPALMSSSPRGSYHFQPPPSSSPGSYSEIERRRASSFGDAKQIKTYR